LAICSGTAIWPPLQDKEGKYPEKAFTVTAVCMAIGELIRLISGMHDKCIRAKEVRAKKNRSERKSVPRNIKSGGVPGNNFILLRTKRIRRSTG
jgi:hypothetical protein